MPSRLDSPSPRDCQDSVDSGPECCTHAAHLLNCSSHFQQQPPFSTRSPRKYLSEQIPEISALVGQHILLSEISPSTLYCRQMHSAIGPHQTVRKATEGNGYRATGPGERVGSVNERLSHHRVVSGQLHDAQTSTPRPRTSMEKLRKPYF